MENNTKSYSIVKRLSPQRKFSHQIQTILAIAQYAQYIIQDMYIAYMDFHNAFKSIGHIRLLAIMEDLGFPLIAIEIVGSIYAHST